MDILGIGGWELVAILLIMLVVAGPKRMIQWSYVLGTYLAKIRKMWSETAKMLQKEFDSAGIDIKVPEEVPTRYNLHKEFKRAIAPMTKPLEDTLNEVKAEVDNTKKAVSFPATSLSGSGKIGATTPAAGTTQPKEASQSAPQPASENAGSNGNGSTFGTWSMGGSADKSP